MEIVFVSDLAARASSGQRPLGSPARPRSGRCGRSSASLPAPYGPATDDVRALRFDSPPTGSPQSSCAQYQVVGVVGARAGLGCHAWPLLVHLYLPVVVEQIGDRRGPDVV